MHKVEIYTDGSCKGNGKENANGGCGYIVVKNGEIIDRFVKRVENTTNQRMELEALILAYEYCKINNIIDAIILSDSSYCLNCALDKWYIRWEKNGFTSSKGNKVKNQDLWEKLIPFFKEDKIKLKKVQGHSNCYFNNFIDSLVTTISSSKTQDLTGKKFNELTVLTLWGNKFTEGTNTTFWLCKCICGNTVIVNHSNLIYNNKKSCGCIKTEHFEDLTNQRFGYLEPLQKIEKTIDNYAIWSCKCHNCSSITSVSSRALKEGQISCGCIKSKGETKISKILHNLNYNFDREVKFSDLLDEDFLKFDFAIFKNNRIYCLIEFQGIQHFSTTSGWNTLEHLEKTQKHDKLKRNYCKEKGLKLIEISYKDYNKLNENYLRNLIEGGNIDENYSN